MNAARILALALGITACAGSTTSTGGRTAGEQSPDSPIVVSPYVVIVSRNIAPDLLEQCTRHVPDGLDGTWSPTPAQARRIEQLFAHRFDTATSCLTNYPPSEPPLHNALDAEHYALQLGGVLLHGRRFIYVNGFPRYSLRFVPSGSTSPQKRPDSSWHRRAVVACDGASDFFGLLYDPAADTLGRIDFNADVIGGAWLCDESRQPRRMPPHN